MDRFENRLNTNLKKWHILNPVWDNEKEDALNVFEMIDLLNELGSENKKLEKENLDLSEELDYYKTKCASLETGYIKAEDENWRLEKSKMDFANELGKTIDENEQLRKENKELQGKASSWKITTSEQIMEQSKLIKENAKLKSICQDHRDHANDFKADCLRLEKENEQLKKQLDYIQNSINEHIKHQKTELAAKALKEIIEDYNEWMLGHKELKE